MLGEHDARDRQDGERVHLPMTGGVTDAVLDLIDERLGECGGHAEECPGREPQQCRPDVPTGECGDHDHDHGERSNGAADAQPAVQRRVARHRHWGRPRSRRSPSSRTTRSPRTTRVSGCADGSSGRSTGAQPTVRTRAVAARTATCRSRAPRLESRRRRRRRTCPGSRAASGRDAPAVLPGGFHHRRCRRPHGVRGHFRLRTTSRHSTRR